MDYILVGVLTAAAAGWIIWAEMNSLRRNAAGKNVNDPAEGVESKPRRSSRE